MKERTKKISAKYQTGCCGDGRPDDDMRFAVSTAADRTFGSILPASGKWQSNYRR